MNVTESVCFICGEAIEDRGQPRASGPEHPLWVHLHNESLRCDAARRDSPVARPGNVRFDQ